MPTHAHSHGWSPVTVLALLALVAAAAYLDWRLWTSPIDVTAEAETALHARSEQAPSQPDFAPPPFTDFRDTLLRPLFNATRRPYIAKKTQLPKEKAAAPEPQITLDQLHLMGVVSRLDGKRILVRSPGAPQGAWHGEGASAEGWTVLEIKSDSAIIQLRGERHEITLYQALRE